MRRFEIIHGDCVAAMGALRWDSIDAIVCDPPYGLEFMGRSWDRFAKPKTSTERADHMNRSTSYGPWGRRERPIAPNTYGHRNERCLTCGKWRVSSNRCQCKSPKWEYRIAKRAPEAMLALQAWSREWASAALEVLKPGGHLLAFGGTRTYHRLTCAIEDAGFEIRDCIAWMYGSGFPKSHNLKGDHVGWGTALKPAFEPIVVARKPLVGTVAANVQEYGTGALNIDGCRIEGAKPDTTRGAGGQHGRLSSIGGQGRVEDDGKGRWPANVVLDEEAARALDEQTGELTSGANPTRRGSDKFRTAYGEFEGQRECVAHRGQDSGGASRFFYCAKASKAERNAGLAGMPEGPSYMVENGSKTAGAANGKRYERKTRHQNTHPTVKPIDLMRWLVRLVTQPGGIVLDPFMGSGSTGVACALEGLRFVGIEREPEYLRIAQRRLRGAFEQNLLDLGEPA